MSLLRFLVLIVLVASSGCRQPQLVVPEIQENTSVVSHTLPVSNIVDKAGNGALLLTRFKSLEELKEVVEIRYYTTIPISNGPKRGLPEVRLSHHCGGREVSSVLKAGIHEQDFVKARNGGFWGRVGIGFRSPYAILNRKGLVSIEKLGRRRPWLAGNEDVAFYHLAETMVFNISETDFRMMSSEDLSEKGYLNTFNHITAQAFMTTIFSERLADFVADVHERQRMPELMNGSFTEEQLLDLENGPVDNYIDLINNEWGQELGKVLRHKYGITRKTYWTPQLLADYLNDIQSYHCWAFQISFQPFRPTDEIVIHFTNKINRVVEK